MKKLVALLMVFAALLAGGRFTNVLADGNGNGFADIPPALPVLP